MRLVHAGDVGGFCSKALGVDSVCCRHPHSEDAHPVHGGGSGLVAHLLQEEGLKTVSFLLQLFGLGVGCGVGELSSYVRIDERVLYLDKALDFVFVIVDGETSRFRARLTYGETVIGQTACWGSA